MFTDIHIKPHSVVLHNCFSSRIHSQRHRMKYAPDQAPSNKSNKRGQEKKQPYSVKVVLKWLLQRDDLTGRPSTDGTGILSVHREITHIW